MNEIDSFVADFELINSDESLIKFSETYALEGMEISKTSDLGHYVGSIDDNNVEIIHHWNDPSGLFSALPDMNTLDLTINGNKTYSVRYPD